MNPYYKEKQLTLFNEDSLNMLDAIPEKSVDMIFADPPYFLSNGGVTVKSGRFVSVDKGDWDKLKDDLTTDDFNKIWIQKCKRALKDDGTIWVSGTHHNIYSIGHFLINNGFKILNNITWYKPNAAPNLSCKYFTHSNEQVIWAKKDNNTKHTFNYSVMKEMNNNKQMRDVWEIALTPKSEKKHGTHPTQKPLKLLNRIILSSTNPGDTVLDPFNGSGTTGIAAVDNGRKYLGFDLEKEYLDLTIERYKNLVTQFSLDI